jgi:hypothetical protein
MTRLGLAASLLLLAGAVPAAAATALATTVEELARASSLVVRGTVEGQECRVGADGPRLYTFVEIRVAEALKGAPVSRVSVRVPGGVLGPRGQRVAGAAAFADGDEVVVFLSPAGEGHQVTGMAQGKFAVRGGEARPDLSGLDLLPGDLPAGERAAGPMPLEELLRRARSVR